MTPEQAEARYVARQGAMMRRLRNDGPQRPETRADEHLLRVLVESGRLGDGVRSRPPGDDDALGVELPAP
jgi:hypothetical protein